MYGDRNGWKTDAHTGGELMTETFVICKTCRPTIVNGRLFIVHNHDEDCAMFLVPTES